jgi:hypothetical protein
LGIAGKYKNKNCSRCFVSIAVWMLLFSCKHKPKERSVERAFYYWKSVFQLNNYEQKLVDSLRVNTIYVKYFDVDWDHDLSRAVPKATLRINDSVRSKHQIVPCVFITNTCIARLDSSQLPSLAVNVSKLISDINAQLNVSNREIQIDVDWTATTSELYFSFLNQLKSELKKDSSTNSAIISATIRLYQVKYIEKTGVPPVDRGLLMAYNMGNLRDPQSQNSILQVSELKKYISYLEKYPLPLDVALPAFEWTVLFRNNKFYGLVQKLPPAVSSDVVSKKLGNNRFEILKDTLLDGYLFKKNDILRVETSDPKEVLNAADEINAKLSTTKLRLALFHLDSLTLSKYSLHELESFFRSLN